MISAKEERTYSLNTKMFRLICFVAVLTSSWVVDGFNIPSSSSMTQGAATLTTSATQLCMSSSSSSQPPSRRDVLKNAAVAAAAVSPLLVINPNAAQAAFSLQGSMTEQSAANKANESYQGVYFDPNHPDGYRVLMAVKGSDGKATMTLCDSNEDGAKTFRDIPAARWSYRTILR